jgi:hypothetical protein
MACDTIVPNGKYQLALKGITDGDGNYQISGIPYTGEGTSYSIVPSMGVHEFNPTQQLRYISPTSMVHNSTDFTDISAFDVSGTVVYEGGTYPVEGCTFEVDGMQVILNGKPVTSAGDGTFTVSVPIGVHKVQVKKTGHTFVNDGYLINETDGSDFNYNAHLANIKFHDVTRVKLIGHIVGGKREHEKPSGFGMRVNNIGSDQLVLIAENERYNFTDAAKIDTFNHHPQNTSGKGDKWATWTFDGNKRNTEQTHMTVMGREITINVSPETGEYVAWVYPELYVIQNITAAPAYGSIYSDYEKLDLRNAPVSDDRMLKTSVYNWTDSVKIDAQGNKAAYYQKNSHSDTVRYHAEWSFYHQANPMFTIRQVVDGDTVKYFGEREFAIDDDTVVPLKRIGLSARAGNPIFFVQDLLFWAPRPDYTKK